MNKIFGSCQLGQALHLTGMPSSVVSQGGFGDGQHHVIRLVLPQNMFTGVRTQRAIRHGHHHQKDTLKRFFERFEQNGLTINRFRADCGSCSEEIVEEIEKHCKSFYIRTNRCSSLYNDIFALRGWKTEEINGIEFELNSILVEKWKGKAYRLVIQRQKRMDGVLDLWEGEYTYRCILTNDYESSTREIVEFYNLRGGKERIFDDMNNGFGWDRLPKSFMAENTVFLLLTALIRNFYKAIIHRLDVKRFGLNACPHPAETCRPLHAPSVHFPKFIHFFVKKSTQKIFFVL